MAIKHTVGDSLEVSDFMREPGWYHCVVDKIDEQPTRTDGMLLDNAAFQVSLVALASTSPVPVKGKKLDVTFWHSKPSDKEFAQKMAVLRQDRFFLAVGAIDAKQLKQSVEIETASLRGRQIAIRLELDKDNKYLRLAGADIYHVDDPAVPKGFMDSGSLSQIPASLRMIGSRVAPPTPSPSTNPPLNPDAI